MLTRMQLRPKRSNIMDVYLASKGLCRKQLVKDHSCIFRAVSDKLFLTQAYHQHVQQMCEAYLARHREEFQDCRAVTDLQHQRDLTRIRDMVALSRMYRLDFVIYHLVGMPPLHVTHCGCNRTILLVCADSGYYDLVHTQSYIGSMAFCQSVLYEALYRGVFKLDSEIEEAVEIVRSQKKQVRAESLTSSEEAESDMKIGSPTSVHHKNWSEKNHQQPFQAPPLPYRIAKALDPCLYRNTELDIVLEEKRAQRLRCRELYSIFSPGDKCKVQLEEDGYQYHAHVQEIFEPGVPVVVYIVELGEKRTVPYSSLQPIPDTNKQGTDARGHPTSDTAGATERRLRRRKFMMPGAAEFQPPSNPVHSPRTSFSNSRRIPEVSQKLVPVPPAPPSSITNCMPAMVEGVDTGAGYCMVPSSMPLTPVTHMTPVSSTQGMSIGMGMGQGGMVYYTPMISVPYMNTIGQINYSCMASQDPMGKDLPADMNTLRYFFNLGIEVHRLNNSMQPQPAAYGPSSPCPQLMNGPPSSPMMMTPMEQGQCFVSPDPPKNPAAGSTSTSRTAPTGKPHAPNKSSSREKSGGQEGGGKGETMEVTSDMSDSGCASCGEAGPSGEEDPDQQTDMASERTDEDAGSTQGEDGADKGRVKSKRKYYMYGTHKLIKPIKDIPPRFQLMLAENSAAKARCEGQPIYMQLSPTDVAVFEDDGTSSLNADAQCFYPTQAYDTVMVDESGLCTYTNSAVAFQTSGTAPAPMLVPPPPMMPPGSGQASVGVVYSTTPPVSTPVMAQPVYTRPLPAPHPGDGKSVSVSNTSANTTGKGPANSTTEDFARPSSASTRLLGKGPDTSHATVASLPVPVTFSQAPPPSSSSMPPPPSAPPIRAGATPNSACNGGGKQCFYVYPSPSAGYSSAPPQGQSMSQGQVVYFMNPQGYPAPPCTAYQPVMAPPSHLPCPPVAVQ